MKYVRERKTNTHMWNLKYDTSELVYRTERDSQTESRRGLPVGEREWDKFEIWDSQTHTIIHKTDKQQDLLLSPGNYI